MYIQQRCSQTPSHVVGFPRFGFGTHGSYRDTVVIYNINIHISINIYILILILILILIYIYMVRDIYAAWIMYIYIYIYMDIEYKGKSSTVAVRIWDVSACEWFFLMATWDVCFRVFFCFHSWFRTCVPCLYLDHLGPPCLKGGVLKAVRPSPSWVSSPRALFLIDFLRERTVSDSIWMWEGLKAP